MHVANAILKKPSYLEFWIEGKSIECLWASFDYCSILSPRVENKQQVQCAKLVELICIKPHSFCN